MSEMVERVAIALAGKRWHEFDEEHRHAGRALARSAIEAMRDPTPAMISASFKANVDPEAMLHKQRWQAMIDAALNP